LEKIANRIWQIANRRRWEAFGADGLGGDWSSEASKRGMLPFNGLSVKNCEEDVAEEI